MTAIYPPWLEGDSSAGASVRACATFSAHIGVDWITVAFGNCTHRAFVFTCTACDTIFRNFVSHDNKIYKMLNNNMLITTFSILNFRYTALRHWQPPHYSVPLHSSNASKPKLLCKGIAFSGDMQVLVKKNVRKTEAGLQNEGMF